jgi:hypothetical protein
VRSAWEAAGLYPLNPKRVISTITRQKTPPKTQQTQSQQYKTPGSTRSLRRTFRRLQNEGKIHPDAAVLLRAGEKLAADRDIIRHENVGLRKAVLHEKKKRKRGKAIYLYDEGETEGQGRFYSPAKVGRARERVAAAEDAQRQHQRAIQDKKLQIAISKAEKAREKEERKAQRQSARQIVREQLAHEKEERQAIREAQRAKKAIETAKRNQEAEEQRAQRLRQKEVKKRGVQSKKRALEEDEVDQPQKRVRLTVSLTRDAGNSRASSIGLNTRVPKQSTYMILNTQTALNDVHKGVQSEDPVSQFGRSGRAIRLPTRFR